MELPEESSSVSQIETVHSFFNGCFGGCFGLLALGLVGCLFGCASSPPPVTAPPVTPPPTNNFYVSASTGSDRNSGSAAAPFATIGKCLSSLSSGQTCVVHGGVYPEMIVPPIDNLSVVAAQGEKVTVTAANTVTGWSAQGNGIYTAPVMVNTTVPMRAGRSQFFPGMQLFYNEVGVSQAQWPAPSADPLHPNWAVISTATAETQIVGGKTIVIPATITDPKAPPLTSAGAFIHIWSGPDPFLEYEGEVQSAPGGSITYANETPFESSIAAPGGFYYLVGGPELLTANTWAYDSGKQLLYWQVPTGVDPNLADVRFKQRYATMDLSGRSNTTIQGIQLVGAGVLSDANSKNNVLDSITATYLSSVQQTHANGPSDHADFYSFGILLDGTGNTLKNSIVAYTALNGVTLHGTSNTVTNSLIHDVNWFGTGAAGIYIGDGVADTNMATSTHNTIYNSGHSAVTIALNPDVGTGASTTHVYAAEISNNSLYDTMFLGTDGGVIYACCADETTGTRIHDNWIHGDVTSQSVPFPKSSTVPHPYAGIYWDNGAGGVQITNNQVWNSFPDIFLHGDLNAAAQGTPPHVTTAVDISSNTIPDATSMCSLRLSALAQATNVSLQNNQVYFQFIPAGNAAGTMLTLQNNLPTAAGATDIFTPGCSFSGCAAGGAPPLFPSGAPTAGVASMCN